MERFEERDGTSREELVQRVALMEQMIAEGRRTTGRYGWIFVLWGLVDLAGLGWERLQPGNLWVWPIVLGSGLVLQAVGITMVRSSGRPRETSAKERSIGAVWSMMGAALTLYVACAMVRGVTGDVSYVPAILITVGMAHAISANILRWKLQGVAAGLWWAAGVVSFFLRGDGLFWMVVAVMFFGLVGFGIVVMARERRCSSQAVARHA